MKTFLTEIQAIDPKDGELKTWHGQDIHAKTWEDAQEICDKLYGYLSVIGEKV